MSSKPENVFIASVHRHLPNTYFEKMCNPWRAGTADVWYSGNLGDLWIEYKFLPKIPKITTILPDLSPRQLKWLNDREAEGRHVAVIVGHPSGGVIWPVKFDEPMFPQAFIAASMARPDLAAWIRSTVGESPCKLQNRCTPSSECCPPDND